MKISLPTALTSALACMALIATGAMTTLTARAAEVPTDLIISEYVEGSSFNKAVEVFNGTDSAIDLSTYTLEVYFNGMATANTNIALAGSLASGSTYVLADNSLAAFADQTTGSSWWNGNDAIVLRGSNDVSIPSGE